MDPELTLFHVVQGGAVHTPDSKERPVMKFLKDENAETDVLPLVNNFDPTKNQWVSNIEPFLTSPEAHANFRREAATLLASDNYK